MPSKAQQQQGAVLDVTFQPCDPSRIDQQFVEGSMQKGAIQAAGTNLCLTESATGADTNAGAIDVGGSADGALGPRS